MKNLLKIALLFAFPLLLINCGDDDDSSPLDALVGEWQSAAITVSGCANSEDNGTITCDPYCFNIEFSSNGSYTLQEADFATGQITTQSGTATVTETTILLCETGDDCSDEDPATYVRTGDSSLTITFTDDGCQFTIVFTKQ